MDLLRSNLVFRLILPILVSSASMYLSCGSGPGASKSSITNISSPEHFQKVLKSSGDRLLIFDLYADWCGPCKLLSPILDTLAVQYQSEATFFKINTDDHPGLAREFNVSGIPLVAFVRKGKVIQNIVGLNAKSTYERAIRTHAGE